MPENERQTHCEYQRDYFDSNCSIFTQPVPEAVQQRTRAIVESAQLDKTSRVLDVGTGMGALIQHFMAAGVKPENVVGCDLSANMLSEAKKRYKGVRFWQGDVVELPETFGQFDAVFFNACFGNIFDQEAALQAVVRALSPSGKVVISHPLGNRFVNKLRAEDPRLVLTPMPSRDQLLRWCEILELDLENYVDEPDFYIATLVKHSGKRVIR